MSLNVAFIIGKHQGKFLTSYEKEEGKYFKTPLFS